MEELINEKIKAFEMVMDWIPGIKIIRRKSPNQNLFICNKGLRRYKLTENFFKHLTEKEFNKLIFDPDNSHNCLVGEIENSDNTYIEKKFYIRYTQYDDKQEVELIIIHNLLVNNEGEPLLVLTQLIPIGLNPYIVNKLKKINDQLIFKKNNYHKFNQLSNRNKEVLSLVVQCFKAEEIGSRLFIGVNTVNTHKKKIKEVLEVEGTHELIQYGHAFDLI